MDLRLAYSIAAVITGFIPNYTLAISEVTDAAWWHPGVILAALSILTAVAAFFAGRRRPEAVEAA